MEPPVAPAAGPATPSVCHGPHTVAMIVCAHQTNNGMRQQRHTPRQHTAHHTRIHCNAPRPVACAACAAPVSCPVCPSPHLNSALAQCHRDLWRLSIGKPCDMMFVRLNSRAIPCRCDVICGVRPTAHTYYPSPASMASLYFVRPPHQAQHICRTVRRSWPPYDGASSAAT